MALHSDGDGVELILMGKVVVVAFWELDLETGTGMPIKTLFDLCREFSKKEDFLIITVSLDRMGCLDGLPCPSGAG